MTLEAPGYYDAEGLTRMAEANPAPAPSLDQQLAANQAPDLSPELDQQRRSAQATLDALRKPTPGPRGIKPSDLEIALGGGRRLE